VKVSPSLPSPHPPLPLPLRQLPPLPPPPNRTAYPWVTDLQLPPPSHPPSGISPPSSPKYSPPHPPTPPTPCLPFPPLSLSHAFPISLSHSLLTLSHPLSQHLRLCLCGNVSCASGTIYVSNLYLPSIYLTLSLYIPLPAAMQKPSCREGGGV
jgi:hypothetical protein